MGKRLYKVAEELQIEQKTAFDILKHNGIDINNSSHSIVSDNAYLFLEKYFQKSKKEEIEEVEEEDNSNIVIETPFNPNEIKVSTRPHTIGQLIDRLEHNEINLNTDFQRLSNLWSDTKKSRFIESLILKLPIPTFYFAESDKNSVWDVVDGLQRISTLKHFILDEVDKRLKLVNLEFLKELNGKSFEDLPRDLKRRIQTFDITIYIIEKGTPDVVKFNIFKRINQGGLVLTPQEIRHAIHQGIAADLIADLVRGRDLLDENNLLIKEATEAGRAFVVATEGKIKSDRMQDRDFANRFVAFYLIPYREYSPDLDSFMNKGLTAITYLNQHEVEKLKDDFKLAMLLAKDIFENDAFRKRFNFDDNRKPINKALFEAISVSFSKLSEKERSILRSKKEIFKEKLMALQNNWDKKFLNSISQGTASKENVEQRFKDIELIIKETLQND
jgi:hypothetical protein